jgi:hypothetical protein
MSLLINGSKGAENYYCDRDRGLRKISAWPDSREEYRRATSSRTASANATEVTTSQTDITVCDLCQNVVQYIIATVCSGLTIGFLSATGSAAAACAWVGLAAGPCLFIAGAMAAITCSLYAEGHEVPEDICAVADFC